MGIKFNRTIDELQKNAVLWWPKNLSTLEEDASIIPKLIETQDKFISTLNLCNRDPFQVFDLIKASRFPANLFLKHLVVLSDFGGEQIQRINREFDSLFSKNSKGKYHFDFVWKGKVYNYIFKELPMKGILNNTKLGADGKGLQKERALDNLIIDIIVILLFASSSPDERLSENLSKCGIGGLLGQEKELEEYTKQKYIWVSRITGGAQANSLGQIAQRYAAEYLKVKLGSSFSVVKNNFIVIPKTKFSFPFDIIVSNAKGKVGIELTFQVTTNSTIERKAGQAANRHTIMGKAHYYIAYIIDGAGNFQRRSAISTICNNSDCTVAYSDKEFDVLADFIKGVL